MSTYLPDLYDLFDEEREDVQFYVRHALASGGAVLELGAGTGRTLLAVARAGVAIDGVDIDDGMLARLRDKLAAEPDEVRERVRLTRADMRRFALPHRYAAVHIPFRAFLHNLDAEAQRDCLRACFEHLRPGGQLAFNVFHPSLRFMAENQGALEGVWRWSGERPLPGGGRVVRSDCTTYDTPRQRVSTRLRYEIVSADGTVERTRIACLELAYLYPADLRELLAAAGFCDARIDGGFDGSPLAHDGDELVVRARRP